MKIQVFSLCIVLLIYSCNEKRSFVPESECIEINNKGTESLIKYQQGKQNELSKAIALFKDAINCDGNYITAYFNLANAYDYRKNYKQELNVYNKLLSFSVNDPVLLTEKGIVLEKLKHMESAKPIYQLAKLGFKAKLSSKPNNISSIRGFLLLLALTEGKESALHELDRITSLNPELASELASESYQYQNFNKEDFLYNKTARQEVPVNPD